MLIALSPKSSLQAGRLQRERATTTDLWLFLTEILWTLAHCATVKRAEFEEARKTYDRSRACG